jgi:hypothetical protein
MPEKNQPLVANLAGAILFFFVLLFIFAKWGPGIPFSVNQITTNKNDFFSVSAEGKVQTKPDSAEATIGFVGNGKTVIEAQTKTNAVMNQVTEAIKKLGVSADDIKSSRFILGNQSFGWNIAEAMKTPRILEVCNYAPNCMPFVGEYSYGYYHQVGAEYYFRKLHNITSK